MKALSDPNRLKIMKILEVKELCVCEITEVLGLAQSTVSKHLKILEDADLVDSWKNGAWVNYKLAENSGNQYAESMQKNIRAWLAGDSLIRKTQAQAELADRIAICATKEIVRMTNG
jgi:ArsR family transcriptional regulator